MAAEDPVKVLQLALVDSTLGLVSRAEAAPHRPDDLLQRVPSIVRGGHQTQQRDAQWVAGPYKIFHAKREDRRDTTLAHKSRPVRRGAAGLSSFSSMPSRWRAITFPPSLRRDMDEWCARPRAPS